MTNNESNVEAAGLRLVKHTHHHWQVLGGTINPIVNVWPNGKGGPKISAGNERARRGTLDDAIDLAGKPAPRVKAWAPDVPWESPAAHAGIIRRFWRWLW
jgi:hypothetical protein